MENYYMVKVYEVSLYDDGDGDEEYVGCYIISPKDIESVQKKLRKAEAIYETR